MLETRNKSIIINDKKFNKKNFLGGNFEGKVYYYNLNNKKYAIKTYLKSYLEYYGINELENLNFKLKKIKTKFILMPQFLLYDSFTKKFNSIATIYYKNYYNDDLFYDLKIKDFINILFKLTNDFDIISQEKLISGDLSIDNILFNNNNIYICDTGCFHFSNINSIKIINRQDLYSLIIDIIVDKINNFSGFNNKINFYDVLYNSYNYFCELEKCKDCFLDFMEYETKNYDTFRDYVKHKIKYL